MDFGKVELKDLLNIDFSLPADGVYTKQVLGKVEVKQQCRFNIGGAKWVRPDWVGVLYPKGTKSNGYLTEYSKQFNSIEMNAMFYGLPSLKTIEGWRAAVSDDFKFCPKFTKQLTHEKRLKNCVDELDAFLLTLDAFGNNLGSVFLALNPNMGVKDEKLIVDFIDLLPNELNLFVELRDESWFNGNSNHSLFEYLKSRDVGMVITDTAGRRDCVHMDLTNKHAFIRFVGNDLHETDYTRINDWVSRIGRWLDAGLEELNFFMHQHDEKNTPVLLTYFIKKLISNYSLDIKVPRLYNDNGPELTLF